MSEDTNCCLNNTIKPSIQEGERFIHFLNEKFKLGLNLSDLIFTIEGKSPKLKGYFMPSLNSQAYKVEESKPLNAITLNTLYLKSEELSPYETIAHEVAHYFNNSLGIKDCSSNQYHNKHFKKVAEMLLLKVEKTNKGYAYTELTEELKRIILEEFKPLKNAFNLFQGLKADKKKQKSRNLLFMCSCGFKIRSAKNEEKPLMAYCGYCGEDFKLQDGEGED